MKREKISEAFGNISSRHIEEAIEFGEKEETSHAKRPWVKWGTLMAACLALVFLSIPLVNLLDINAPLANIQDGTPAIEGPLANTENKEPGIQNNNNPGIVTPPENTGDGEYGKDNNPSTMPPDTGSDQNKDPGSVEPPAGVEPPTVEYGSIEEAHNALKYNTLYSNLILDESQQVDINVLFSGAMPDTEISFANPKELVIHSSYDYGEFIDMVDYYVLFNKESVDDSYIGGYVEQGLTKEINGVTVHYCLFESNGRMHGQAKFLHDGNLYVIDVKSSGTEHTLDTYLNMVLK